jgi:hypothetical protein
MDANLSIKQPWHTEYCHLKFEYSDLSANYPTHYMLTLTKIYAVKTGQPRVMLQIYSIRAQAGVNFWQGKTVPFLSASTWRIYFINLPLTSIFPITLGYLTGCPQC